MGPAIVWGVLWAWLSDAGEAFTGLQRQQQLQHGQEQSKSSIRGHKAELLCKQAPFLQPTLPWDTRAQSLQGAGRAWLRFISLNNGNFFMSELLLDEEELTRTQHTVHNSAVGSQAPKKGRESPSPSGKIRRYSCKLPCPAPVGRQVALKVPALNMRLYPVLSWIWRQFQHSLSHSMMLVQLFVRA